MDNHTAGQCVRWRAEAGIGEDAQAITLMNRENGACDPQRYNQQGSDACGIAQELPCGKSGCGIPPNANGACQTAWMRQYVMERYGSWAAANRFWECKGWCVSKYGGVDKKANWY